MTAFDLFLQQAINGLSLGAMYALLALGFTLVYGILELINFSHFNVFMVGSFIALWTLQQFGLSGQDTVLVGLPLAGVLLAAFAVTMLATGMIGVGIERFLLRPLARREGAGGDDHHHRRVVYPVQQRPADRGRGFEELPESAAAAAVSPSAARCCGCAKCSSGSSPRC